MCNDYEECRLTGVVAVDHGMVLEVIADTNEVLQDWDVKLLKQSCRPDTRKLQELRRMDRPRRDDDFLGSKYRLPRRIRVRRKL